MRASLDLAGSLRRLQAERGASRGERLRFRVGRKAGEAGARERSPPLATSRAARSASASVGPPGSGMKTADLAWLEDVEVEGDVDAVAPVERAPSVGVDPDRRDELGLGRVEIRAPDESDVGRPRRRPGR